MPIIGVDMTQSEPLHPSYREFSEAFEKFLRMATYPLAVQMLEKEEDIPHLVKSPVRHLGCHLNTCQCFAISRRFGEMIIQRQEDMWCFEPAIGYGFTGGNPEAFNEGLKFFLEGRTRYPDGAKDLATARKWAHSLPRFEPGKYMAIVSAPLMRAGFEPDLVLLYVNPAQLNQILAGLVFKWGESVTCEIAAHGGSVNYVVPPIQRRSFWVNNPCFGDIATTANPPDELVFSAPMEKVEALLSGMEQRRKYRGGLPLRYKMEPEGWLPPAYSEIALES